MDGLLLVHSVVQSSWVEQASSFCKDLTKFSLSQPGTFEKASMKETLPLGGNLRELVNCLIGGATIVLRRARQDIGRWMGWWDFAIRERELMFVIAVIMTS